MVHFVEPSALLSELQPKLHVSDIEAVGKIVHAGKSDMAWRLAAAVSPEQQRQGLAQCSQGCRKVGLHSRAACTT